VTDAKHIVARAVEESIGLRGSYRQHLTEWLLIVSTKLKETFGRRGKVLIAGNGGSAADSQHFAAELVVRLTSGFDREALPAIALTADSCVVTAAANDYEYVNVFARQLQALGREGDLFIGISTSGKSENIVKAFSVARDSSLATIGLFGRSGLSDSSLCDCSLRVPTDSVMRIQEEHCFALHLLVELTEQLLFRPRP
jgi:D-sedoheptulose 7-phosphate isomerase